jgi:DNA-binding transcriptional ArsR family regulator
MSTIPAVAPDYPLEEYVHAETADQLKAIGHKTRALILDLVLDRAATVTEVAAALGLAKGTVGYHMKVLEDAGLVRVVATRQVRAITAKYYGRVGRTIVIKGDFLGEEFQAPLLAEALAEAREADRAGKWVKDDPALTFTMRHIRLTQDQAAQFARRLEALAVEFSELPRGGDTVYALIAGVYPTHHPTLGDEAP